MDFEVYYNNAKKFAEIKHSQQLYGNNPYTYHLSQVKEVIKLYWTQNTKND